ncbi:MAG: NAD(P)/FAD-dependent oxidoreductase, partial [Deltaproteobacteria bacterium]|nr:NAD(P)/FAD-dependent oxidoreductase [Deltaproteobacteria bacterium]
MERVLIVGNGYAGARAAEVLGAVAGFEVLHVSDEAYPAYCRHLLPGLAAGERAPEELLLPPGNGNGRGAGARSGIAVSRLIPKSRRALLSNGEEISFDHALIATGARVFVPEKLRHIFGRCGNVVAMRQMKEALSLRRILEGGKPRVAIIGAGRIGILLAEALKRAGARISLVDIAPEILPTMLHGDVASLLRPHLEAEGDLSVLAGREVTRAEIEGEMVRALHLSDGTVVPCDAVVLATGVVPNTEFLEGEGDDWTDGLPVDARMETSAPGIYAAGDVIRFQTVTGKTAPGQLILNARLQAEVAARNISGERATCPPLFVGNVVKIGPVIGAVAGEVDGTGTEDYRVGDSFLRVTLEEGGMTGFQ